MKTISWQLAWRYLRRHPQRKHLAFSTIVSVAGVSLGVGALIVVMSVLSGLRDFIEESVLTVDAPLVITPETGNSFNITDNLLAKIENTEGVLAISPYIEGEAIIRLAHRDMETGCRLKGVDPIREQLVTSWQEQIVYGDSRLETEDGFPGTVMGLYLAEAVAHPQGDTLLFYPPRAFFSSRGFTVGVAILTGAIETGLPANDQTIAYVTLEFAGRLFLPEGGFSGVSIRPEENADVGSVRMEIESLLPESLKVETWQERNPTLTASMNLEKMGSFAAILLITIVATFNIFGTIARSIVERRQDIAILKAIGASNSLILRVFLWEGVLVGLSGVFIGLILGLSGCYLIGNTNIITLPDVYSFHDNLPLRVVHGDVLLVCLAAISLSLVSSYLPARKAASLDPLQGLKS